MSVPKFIQDDFDCVLCCAHCGSEYMHQHSVNVYFRGEDEDTGIHALVGLVSAIFDSKMDDNPSSRRSGLSIELSCEECNKTTILQIIQHKGITKLRVEVKK